jgi:hypothetical protein
MWNLDKDKNMGKRRTLYFDKRVNTSQKCIYICIYIYIYIYTYIYIYVQQAA